MNVELIMKGSIIMKKKRLLSLFAAFAVALCCLIVPGNSRIGLNTVAEASVTDGLSIEALDGADIEALMPGDRFKVTLTIKPVDELLDTIYFNIKYNSAAFDVVSWYDADADVLAPKGALSESAGIFPVEGEDGFSYLSYGAAGLKISAPAEERTIDLSAGAVFEATLMVRTDVPVTGGSYEITLDKTADCFQCGYFVSATGYIECWKPSDADSSVIAKVANSISGKIDGIDLGDVGGTVVVLVYDGTTLITSGDVDPVNGRFTIKSGPEDATKTYDLKLGVRDASSTVRSLWGVFTERSLYPEDDKTVTLTPPKFVKNKLTDKTGIIQIKGSKDIRPIGMLTFRLFGDVNKDGSVGAGDATQILRHIVGNASSIDGASDEETEINKGIANVMDTDSVLNAKDATQILRKVIGVPSMFNGRA